MINISYYAKQRIVHYIIHVIMIAFLIISLFPIGWMLFNSFKDNTEILSGRIPLSRAGNDCIGLFASDNNLFAFSADGGITKLDRASLAPKGYISIRAQAVSFTVFGDRIFVSSGIKGLTVVDKNSLKIVKRVPYPLWGMDLSKIASTSIAGNGKQLWIGVEYKGFEKILEFNMGTLNFSRLIDISSDLSPFSVTAIRPFYDTLWVGGNKGLMEVSLSSGKVSKTYTFRAGGSFAQVSSMAGNDLSIFMGTNLGLFEFSPRLKGIVRRYDTANGLISEQINSVAIKEGRAIVGTATGLSVLDLAIGSSSSASELLQKLAGDKIVEGKLSPAEIFSATVVGNLAYVGGTHGRVSAFDLTQGKVTASTMLNHGYVLARWRNYVDMWHNIDFGLYLRNSVIICGISTLIAMVLATLAAYALSRFTFPGARTFGFSILATQMIPAIMYLIPIYITFVKITEFTGIPLKGTFYGIILVYSAFFVPFSIWILRGFFAAIPVELEEAARIDGCNPLQVFWYIVLPLAIPGIIATGVYIFLTSWDELMFAWVLTNADTMTIPVGIRNFVGNYQNRFDLMMAAASVATVPVLILFFMLQKYIVKGLTAGAVKG